MQNTDFSHELHSRDTAPNDTHAIRNVLLVLRKTGVSLVSVASRR